jgi:hypothetical protein
MVAALSFVAQFPGADAVWLKPVLDHVAAGTVEAGLAAAKVRVSRDEDDAHSRFAVGALLVHAGRPGAGGAWLDPLRRVEGVSGNLWVYLGLCAAASDQPDKARRYLDYAVGRADARVYASYHRGVLLRDQDRGRALGDARLAVREMDADSLWGGRAAELVAALEACQRDGITRCEGPWSRRSRSYPLGWLAATIVLVTGALRTWGSSANDAEPPRVSGG